MININSSIMASQLQYYELLLLSTLLFLFISLSSQSHETLVLPVRKDPTTLQYITGIYQRTPLIPVKLVVDIGSRYVWVDCDNGAYISSSYRPALCNSTECSLAESVTCSTCNGIPRPGCNNNTCGLFPENSVINLATSGDVIDDVVAFRSIHGNLARVPHFLFSCGSSFLLQGLASGVKGMAGFGRTRIAIPTQLSSVFNIHPQFALCLFSSPSANGFIFVGNGGNNYKLAPGIDISSSLMRTPLITNPVSTGGISFEGETSSEYFIGVSSIKINGKEVKVNTTLLGIDEEGVGGTKISTVTPFTTMETSIYKAVTRAFIKAAEANYKMKIVAPVKPFKTCFSSESIKSTRVGPDVPIIDLVLGSGSEDVYWRVFGANSMVEVKEKKGVLCLGFVDGGLSPRTSIVIGGHQLENNFLEFDLATSVLGFSSSLLFKQTTCANFYFGKRAP